MVTLVIRMHGSFDIFHQLKILHITEQFYWSDSKLLMNIIDFYLFSLFLLFSILFNFETGEILLLSFGSFPRFIGISALGAFQIYHRE